MSYFGASWGTQLGAVYRSMFPGTISRMWLDSVVSPQAHDLAYRFDNAAKATEQDFGQFAQWLATHDSVYGLGDTPAKVRAAVLAMRQAADAHPGSSLTSTCHWTAASSRSWPRPRTWPGHRPRRRCKP